MYDNVQNNILEATNRVRATMSSRSVERAERMAAINKMYVGTPRDELLNQHLDTLFESLITPETNQTDKKRILIITGESGAGKSRLLDHNFAQREAFQPHENTYGTITRPMLRYNAPKPCTPKMVALEGLSNLGYPVASEMKEAKAWQLFRHQLAVRQSLFVHIDEAQHAVTHKDKQVVQTVSDGFKNLVQMDWPVRLILSGVSPLEELRLRDRQIRERSIFMHLDKIDPDRNEAFVRSVVETIVTNHADLDLDDFLTKDFVGRLVHACGGSFGSIIQMVRTAVRQSFLHDTEGRVVRKSHFKTAYQSISGCAASDNIFARQDWGRIDAGLGVLLPPKDTPVLAGPGEKTIRYGERP